MMETTEILKELVSFPVFGGESNLTISQWIQDYLQSLQISYEVVTAEAGLKEGIHCRIGPAVDGGIILSGHMDVVPVAGQPWDTDPFILTEKDDKLYARGSCDMKGFLSCCLSAIPAMKAAQLKRPIYLALSFDEEIGCRSGDLMAESIMQFYDETPGGAIIGEPTMLQPMIGQKGIMVYTTRVTGSQGHSSRIKEEVDAIHEAAHLIVWLEKKMDQLIAEGHVDDRFHPNHTSIHVGTVKGGTAFNIIANECTFEWDFRNIPADSAESIISDFESFCREREERAQKIYPEFKIENIPFHPPVPPLDTSEDESIVELIKQISGRSDLSTVSFAAEAGQFSRVGFPAVICGPGDIKQAHRANEFVSKEQLRKCEMMIQDLTRALAT